MHTKTLTEYLASIPRRPYLSDEQIIKSAFERNQLRLTEALLDFQLQYAGYHHQFYGEFFVYGILHEESVHLPTLDVDFDDENPKNILYTCMDCRPSEMRALNEKGVFYRDYTPIAESFTKYLEQRAFRWKLSQRTQWEAVNLAEHVQDAIKEEQPGKLEEFIVAEVSDRYAKVYQPNQDLVIKSMPEQITAWKAAGTRQQLFYFEL
ncbi:hypothetical protein BKI52_20650 [marine bacterium AO1-C]|nr:hypothetical protein BKI52_20650 [marine bacterium AO1-C]